MLWKESKMKQNTFANASSVNSNKSFIQFIQVDIFHLFIKPTVIEVSMHHYKKQRVVISNPGNSISKNPIKNLTHIYLCS